MSFEGFTSEPECSCRSPRNAEADREIDPTDPADLRALTERIDEELLGGPSSYTINDIARQVGMTREEAENYWRWLGLPERHPGEYHYADSDIYSMHEICLLASSEHLDDAAMRTLVRSFGHTMERLATWQVEAIIEHHARLYGLDDVSARLSAADTIPHLAGLLTRQLNHVWRRQLAAVTKRLTVEAIQANGASEDARAMPLQRAVGFADVVGFTKRSRLMPPEELAGYIQDFENSARDLIAEKGGRVIKSIGDEVMFVADNVTAGAEIALAFADPATLGGRFPVRVGMVWCRVLTRLGDIYGPGVNLASRLTELGDPGEVTVDAITAEILASSSRYQLDEKPEVEVQGVGMVSTAVLTRASAANRAIPSVPSVRAAASVVQATSPFPPGGPRIQPARVSEVGAPVAVSPLAVPAVAVPTVAAA
ncbi:MAG: adenylate/guanylate cyclase domain-containing protein [Cellulomonadaceae bacterium]|nr:adenylate/guanylate cyclase domain-containing protein [Cellulomonadaceae bacterium]